MNGVLCSNVRGSRKKKLSCKYHVVFLSIVNSINARLMINNFVNLKMHQSRPGRRYGTVIDEEDI